MTVTVEPSDDTPDDNVTVNEGDATVVVETPSTEDSSSEGGQDSLAFQVGQLVERMERLEATAAEATVTASIAQETADTALNESLTADETAEDVGDAVEVVADAVVNDNPEALQETADVTDEHADSILPTKKHWFHKSWRELLDR